MVHKKILKTLALGCLPVASLMAATEEDVSANMTFTEYVNFAFTEGTVNVNIALDGNFELTGSSTSNFTFTSFDKDSRSVSAQLQSAADKYTVAVQMDYTNEAIGGDQAVTGTAVALDAVSGQNVMTIPAGGKTKAGTGEVTYTMTAQFDLGTSSVSPVVVYTVAGA